MIMLLSVLASWMQAPSTSAEGLKLVAEQGSNASFNDGVLELRGTRGWVRFRRPVLDFDVEFEIRAVTPDADPGLIVRTWLGQRRWPSEGYRLTLPTVVAADPSSLLRGRQRKVKVLQVGKLDLRAAGEWQRVHVAASGPRIRVVVNGTLAGEFGVEDYGGFVMFDNRKGLVEVRNMALRVGEPNEPIPSDVRSAKQIADAGGESAEVIHEVKPVYSPAALRALAKGLVSMEAVVLPDGSVGPVRVTRSLHPDLDISGVAALKAWRFRPATVDNNAVPVVVEVEMTFRLK